MSTAGPKSPFEEAQSWNYGEERQSALFWSLCTNSFGSVSHNKCLPIRICVLLWSSTGASAGVKQTPCCTDEPLVIPQGKLVPITESSWVWLNGSSGCFFSMTSSRSKGWHGCYKEHRVMNQDPPIHPQFNIIPRYPNTPAFNYSWPGRKGNRVRYIYTRKLN